MQFLVFAPNSWSGQWMNRQQLFSRISTTNDVMYATGMFATWDIGSPRYGRAPLTVSFEPTGTVTLANPGKFNVRFHRLPSLDKYMLARFARDLHRQCNASEPICLYIFHPKFYEYRHFVRHHLLVYHAYDDFSKQGGDSARTHHAEMELLSDATTVFASSKRIAERLRTLSGRQDVVFIPNGVDYDHFSMPKPEPADLRPVPNPRVSYVGSINEKVDLSLLYYLVEANPAVSFVLVGPIGRVGTQGEFLRRLVNMSNVHLLGEKNISDLPAYMQHSNLNIMLYRTDETLWPASGYPLKLHEYLAAGPPILSSPLDSVSDFSDVVQLADSPSEWLTKLRAILRSRESLEAAQVRQSVARSNDWIHRARQICALLNCSPPSEAPEHFHDI